MNVNVRGYYYSTIHNQSALLLFGSMLIPLVCFGTIRAGIKQVIKIWSWLKATTQLNCKLKHYYWNTGYVS